MAWDVWEVYPSAVEQRMSGEFPAVQDDDGRPQERREVRIRVPAALEGGWLAFQSGTQRRRLAPIPASWISLSDEDLIRLLARADPLDGDGRK